MNIKFQNEGLIIEQIALLCKVMKAEIVSIGDEILIGQITNTNAVWMAQELNKIGIWVNQISSIGDTELEITRILNESLQRSDIVLITGGLGPTKDDITKKTLAQYFNCGYRLENDVLEFIIQSFEKRNIPVTKLNRDQALVPELCKTIFNNNGTAPGMWFDYNNKIIIAMPGVPYEMIEMMEHDILPKLQSLAIQSKIIHKTLLTTQIPESKMSLILESFENELPDHIKLAYLPNYGLLRLRLTAMGNHEDILNQEINTQFQKMIALIPSHNMIIDSDMSIEQVLFNLLKNQNKSIAIAESCTGGYLSNCLVKLPNISSVFNGSIIAYSNTLKINLLDVDPNLIEQYGAVSKQVCQSMLEGIIKKCNATCGIAISGIAGPNGGSIEKPVGTVVIGTYLHPDSIVKTHQLFGNRQQIIEKAAIVAFNQLRLMLIE